MRRQRVAIRILPAALSSLSLLLAVLPCLFLAHMGYSQDGEFQKNANGLIYPEETVQQLRHMVDSLNLKFKVCAVNPRHQASSQGIGHYICLRKNKIAEARNDAWCCSGFVIPNE